MENQLSIDWDTISGVYDRTPFFPITLIDTEILDDWAAYPSVWEVEPYQPERCPVVLEVCEGGLCGPSVHALEANVLPSTTGGTNPILYYPLAVTLT